MQTTREIYMEDVVDMAVAVAASLEKNGIKFTTQDGFDEFDENLIAFLESQFGHPNYRDYN